MREHDRSQKSAANPESTNSQDESAKDAVYRVVRAIPSGKVLTYGTVADMAGLGRAARFVGSTLRKLPAGSALPWHRVINSQGKIALPEHHPGRKLQETKLNDEGITFTKGRIDLRVYLWIP